SCFLLLASCFLLRKQLKYKSGEDVYMFSRFSRALLLCTSFLVNNTALGLVYHGAGEGKSGERSIIFGQVPNNVEQRVILTICADSESEEINIPDLQAGPFRIVTNPSGPLSAESCASVVIAYQGTGNTDSCVYAYHESEMTVNNDAIRLSGITVSPGYWKTLQDYSGWRYAGSLEQPQGPYMISASNDKLLWLNRKVPSKTYGFTDYRLNQTTGDFYYRFNRLNADHLEPYADVLSSFGLSDLNDGISLINAGDEQDDFFAGVQSNGFVLTYNMSISSPPSSVADPLAPLSADYWVQQGFGGSPRPGELGGLCLINGTCIGLSPGSNAVATDHCPCEFNYPSKGESIAVSPTGNCLVVANPLYDEINTLLRSKENPAIFDRSFFNEVGGKSLIGKRPEIVAIDNTGRVLIVNKNSNTAILCSLQEDQDECELTDCREQCQPEYASVTSAGFLEDSNGSFFVTNAMDHRIHVFDAGAANYTAGQNPRHSAAS
ncbi:hypothetical protein, partial [Endozoicomonas sp.]|uniref:hypothetical protein n=1 Tax=Endozoicomonas sp. TaxID=1892382 RepID=UPI003D9B4A70